MESAAGIQHAIAGSPRLALRHRAAWSLPAGSFPPKTHAAYVIAYASIGMADRGANAAAVYARLAPQYLAPIEFRVFPRSPLAALAHRAASSTSYTCLTSSIGRCVCSASASMTARLAACSSEVPWSSLTCLSVLRGICVGPMPRTTASARIASGAHPNAGRCVPAQDFRQNFFPFLARFPKSQIERILAAPLSFAA